MYNNCKKTFVALAVSLIAQQAVATDNQLYLAPPPDDAAFIRWLEGAQDFSAFGVSSSAISPGVYHPVSASKAQGAAAGQFYSVSVGPDGAQITIEEPQRDDRSKVHVVLLNASSNRVHVDISGTTTNVIAATEPFNSASRAVNPVKAPLSVMSDGGTEIAAFDLTLRRGQNVTLLVTDQGAELIENSFGENLLVN